MGVGKKRGPPGAPVFWVPVGRRSFVARIRKAVERSGLDVQVKEKCGRPLLSMLCSSALEHTRCTNVRCKLCQAPTCEDEKQWGRKPHCSEKDFVYAIVCEYCNKTYIGETKQPAAKRFLTRNRLSGPETFESRHGLDDLSTKQLLDSPLTQSK